MPNYAWDISIEADRSDSNPVEQELDLTIGVITKLEIKFPRGCHGMVKVRLLRFKFQLIPLSGGEWVTGDDEAVYMPEYYELKETPAHLTFQGCSPDTSYNHTVTVRITVLPVRVASMIPLVELLTKLFRRLGLIR